MIEIIVKKRKIYIYCFQHLHWSNHNVDSLDSGGGIGWPRATRPRVNSAIDVAGFLSQVNNKPMREKKKKNLFIQIILRTVIIIYKMQ